MGKKRIEKRLGPVTYFVRIQGKFKQILIDHILAHQTEGTKNKQLDDNWHSLVPDASDTSVNPMKPQLFRLVYTGTPHTLNIL